MSENKHLGSSFSDYLVKQGEKDAVRITQLETELEVWKSRVGREQELTERYRKCLDAAADGLMFFANCLPEGKMKNEAVVRLSEIKKLREGAGE